MFVENVDYSYDCVRVPVSIVSVWNYLFLSLWKIGTCMMPKSYAPLSKTKPRYRVSTYGQRSAKSETLHDWLQVMAQISLKTPES